VEGARRNESHIKCCCFDAEKLGNKFQKVPQYLMKVARVFVAHSKDREERYGKSMAAAAAAASLCQHE
jgi:hypothetical protein